MHSLKVTILETAGAARWRWLAAIPSVLGFAVALRCVWDFGWAGRGTPAPIAPPQRLVVVGFYRHVRNPMYVGFAAGWIGLWIVFGRASAVAIVVAAAVAAGIHLFVVFYEEPILRQAYGSEFGQRCLLARRLVQSGVRFVEVSYNLNFLNGVGLCWHPDRNEFFNAAKALDVVRPMKIQAWRFPVGGEVTSRTVANEVRNRTIRFLRH